MRLNHVMVLALGAVLLAGSAPTAAAQTWNFSIGRADRSPYQEGMEQGMWDARHSRPSHPVVVWRWGRDRVAYENGYNRGYEIALAENRRLRFRESEWETARAYPQGVSSAISNVLTTARQTGYQDGLDDGALDRRIGNGFRLTQTDNYLDADRGFQARFVRREQYQQQYREGYEQGYRRGFRER